jgi:hypothetical protein
MSIPSTSLLNLLGAGNPAPARPLRPDQIAGSDFGTLLQKARELGLTSGRDVTVARGAGVTLTDEQLKLLSAAADRAEAQGATRALVMIDGKALKLDVAMREVTGQVDLASGGVLTGVDSVITMPGTAGKAKPGQAQPEVLPLPGRTQVRNPSLLDVLSRGARPPE